MADGNNIEALREAKGWKRPKLAELMNTSTQQVERLEKGQRKLTQDWINRAAKALGVAPAAIFTTNFDTLLAKMPDVPPIVASDAGAIALRQIDLAFSMGDGTNLDDYVEEGTIEFDANLIRAITRSPPERLIVARGVGDSMMPTLLHDDMTIIDTLQHQLNMQDRIWAVSIYGAGAMKRLRTIGRERILVISDNPAVADQEVDAADLRILGRLIWSGRRH